ncbi:hemin uptake protein HemP [Comamonadaceae bacterium OH2545_COT-014]|nr:hemin uptake protein HemP [Comamonadaceae bacterium OH2545_COT-014]
MRSTHDTPACPAVGKRAPLPAAMPAPVSLTSDHLLQGRKQVEIRHNGAVYRLQATKLGKLILTK